MRYGSVTSGYSYEFLSRAAYSRQTGDSGGRVYVLHHACGIHQGGSDDCAAIFQSIVQAQDGLNVDVIRLFVVKRGWVPV